jgi:hypothetical protein
MLTPTQSAQLLQSFQGRMGERYRTDTVDTVDTADAVDALMTEEPQPTEALSQVCGAGTCTSWFLLVR